MPKRLAVDGRTRFSRGNSGRRYRPSGRLTRLADGSMVPRVQLGVFNAEHRPLPTISDTMDVDTAERYALDILSAVAEARYEAAVAEHQRLTG